MPIVPNTVTEVPGASDMPSLDEITGVPLDNLAASVVDIGSRQVGQASFAVQGENPDLYARKISAAKESGVSPQFIFGNPELEAFEAKKRNDQMRLDLSQRRHLRQWASNPDNFAVGNDDFKNLGPMSEAADQYGKTRDSDSFFATPYQIGKSLYGGGIQAQTILTALRASETGLDPSEAARSIVDSRQKYAELQANRPKHVIEGIASMQEESADVNKAYSEWIKFRPELEDRDILRSMIDLKNGVATFGSVTDQIATMVIGHPRFTAEFIAEMFPLALPSIAGRTAAAGIGAGTGLATGPAAPIASPILAALGFILGTAGQAPVEIGSKVMEALERRNVNLDSYDDLVKAFSNQELMAEIRRESRAGGLTTSVLENLLFLRAGKRLAKVKTNPSLVRYGTLTGEAIILKPPRAVMARALGLDILEQNLYGGASAIAGQSAAFGPQELDLSEFGLEFVGDLAQSPIDVAFGEARHIASIKGETVVPGRASHYGVLEGGVFRPTVFSEARTEALGTIEAVMSISGAKNLLDIGELANESKLVKRQMPEQIAELMKIAGGSDSKVYFDREDLNDLAQEKGLSAPDILGGLTEGGAQLWQEAVDTNSRIAVPMSDFVSNGVTKTELYQDLVSISRRSENGPNVPQAVEILRSMPGRMKDIAERAATAEAQLDVITERIYKELESSGRPRELVSKETAVHRAVIQRISSLSGLSPEQLDTQFKITAKNIKNLRSPTKRGAEVRQEDSIQEPKKGIISKVKELFQSAPKIPISQDRRGKITITTNGETVEFNIALLQKADKSTFIHEASHAYLTILENLSKRPDATPEVKKMMADFRELVGLKEGQPITANEQEAFAEWFERYLQTGKAPNAKLLEVFRSFKKWLFEIYQGLRETRIPFSDEVRDFMDRLVATDAEIAQMKISEAYREIVPEGSTEEEISTIERLQYQADEEAREQLGDFMLANYSKQKMATKDAARKMIRKDISAELNTNRDHIALALMKNGKSPNGDPLPDGIEALKIDPDTLPEGITMPSGTTAKGGEAADTAASLFGYDSVKEMSDVLNKLPAFRTAVTMATEAQILAEFGDPLLDENLPDEVVVAMHSPARADVLERSMNLLAQKSGQRLPDRRIRQAALRQRITDKLLGSNVKSLLPHSFFLAEVRSSRDVGKHIAKNDFPAALKSKGEQVYNHEAYKISREMKSRINSDLEYSEKIDNQSSRKAIGKTSTTVDGETKKISGGEENLAQIDRHKLKFSLPSRDGVKRYEPTKTLQSWVGHAVDDGFPMDFGDIVYSNEPISFRDLKVSQFIEVMDALRQMAHYSRYENELISTADHLRIEDVVSDMKNHSARFYNIEPGKKHMAKNLSDTVGKNVKGFFAATEGMEWLVLAMDGFERNGPWWRSIFKPVVDGANVESDKSFHFVKDMEKLQSDTYSKIEQAKWALNPIYIKELDVQNFEFSPNMTKPQIIAAAMNRGNPYNWKAYKEGLNLTDAQGDAILSHMDDKDWTFALEVAKIINSFWPEAEKLEREVNGLAPEKIQGVPFQTSTGRVMPGWYYPVSIDQRHTPRKSGKETIRAMAGIQEAEFKNYAASYTRRGSLKERTYTAGLKLRDDLGVIGEHIHGVIHDLSLRKAVIDVNRILANPTTKQTLDSVGGEFAYDEMKKWIRDVANAGPSDQRMPGQKLLDAGANGLTKFYLGWKVMSSSLQLLGYANTFNQLMQDSGSAKKGAKYAAAAVWDLDHNPLSEARAETKRFIYDNSEAMVRRKRGDMDREVKNISSSLNIAGNERGVYAALKSLSPDTRKTFFYLIIAMDGYVSERSWLAAYRMAISGDAKGIKMADHDASVAYADSVIRMTQSSGSIESLPRILRNKGYLKYITMFATSMYPIANAMMASAKHLKVHKNVGLFIASILIVGFAQNALESFLRGEAPDLDDDWDEKAKWALRKAVFAFPESVVILRDVSNVIERKLDGRYAQYRPTPLITLGDRTVKSVGDISDIIFEDEDITRSKIENWYKTTGMWTGLLPDQVWKTGEYSYDWLEGNERPDSAMEGVWRAVYAGKEK